VRYEKGRKDASRRKIIEAASERFREDGIAATGLASVMSDAGMTNGAFYPHFQSKADLVRETVAATMDAQTQLIREAIANGGLEAAIATYLSPEHRDNPASGCTLAALLPELARQPLEARAIYAERLKAIAHEFAAALPANTPEPEAAAMGIYATLIGSLQLARAVEGTELSDRILAAGRDAARAVVRN
jgi:TetR/AcrR family transcriptional repressor of nem operon